MELLQDLHMSGLGAALLRFILAGFWTVHWWYKVGHRGMTATQGFFLQQGLPAWLAWFDVGFEVIVAACLVLGIYVPLLCLTSLPILFASMWIYRKNGFYFSSGGIELPILWACAQIALAMLGPGAFRACLRVAATAAGRVRYLLLIPVEDKAAERGRDMVSPTIDLPDLLLVGRRFRSARCAHRRPCRATDLWPLTRVPGRAIGP